MRIFTKNLFSVFFIIFISMSLFVTTGCDDDDDVDEMIGTWVLFELEDGSDTMSPSEAGISITVIFTTNSYTATVVEDGYSDIDNGTWTRTSSTSIIIIHDDGDSTTLIKEGSYYTSWMDGVKMKFRKL